VFRREKLKTPFSRRALPDADIFKESAVLNKRALLISAALLVAACSDPGSTKGSGSKSPAAKVASSDVQAAAPESPTTKAVPTSTSTEALHSWSKLVKLDAIDLLPTATTSIPVAGNPETEFFFGVIDGAEKWAQISRIGGIDGFPDIDFASHHVVFALLGAQSNALSNPSWAVEDGVATLTFEWDRIEPRYVDATPGIFVAVPRGGYHAIAFRTSDDHHLATHSLQNR
jgi:hypothetical protein